MPTIYEIDKFLDSTLTNQPLPPPNNYPQMVLMVSQVAHLNFPLFDGVFPLNVATNISIPQFVIKINPSFDGIDNTIFAFENCKDVLNQVRNHDVTTEYIMV